MAITGVPAAMASKRRQPETFIERRKDQGHGTLIENSQLIARDRAQEGDAGGKRAGFERGIEIRSRTRGVAGKDQARWLSVSPPAAQASRRRPGDWAGSCAGSRSRY